MFLIKFGLFVHILNLLGRFDKVATHDLILDLPCKDILEVLAIGNWIIGFFDYSLVSFDLFCYIL